MNSLPKEVRVIYKILQLELYEAYYRIKILDQLYVQNNPADVLYKVNPHFFSKMFIIYLESAISIIGRLLDPPTIKGKNNVCLRRLMDLIDKDCNTKLLASLANKYTEITNKSERIIYWRHKQSAHTDEEVILFLVQGPKVNIREIKDVLELIKEFLNIFENEYYEFSKEYNITSDSLEKSIALLHNAEEEMKLSINEKTVPYENYLIDDGVNLIKALQKTISI
jgi:hypothetical protein